MAFANVTQHETWLLADGRFFGALFILIRSKYTICMIITCHSFEYEDLVNLGRLTLKRTHYLNFPNPKTNL